MRCMLMLEGFRQLVVIRKQKLLAFADEILVFMVCIYYRFVVKKTYDTICFQYNCRCVFVLYETAVNYNN